MSTVPLILPICLSYIAGVLSASLLASFYHPLLFPVTVFLIAITAYGCRRERLVVLAAVCVSFFLLGVIRWQGKAASAGGQFPHGGQTVSIQALVVAAPEIAGNSVKLVVVPRNISVEGISANEEASGARWKMEVILPKSEDYQYGDLLEFKGTVERPLSGSSSYAENLGAQGIYYVMKFPAAKVLQHGLGNPIYRLLFSLRETLCRKLEMFFPSPHSSLLAGMVLGVKRYYSDSFYEAIRRAGVMHLIVASGFNITVLLGAVGVIAAPFKRRFQVMLLAIVVFCYAVMAGMEPPVVRAVIMGMLTYLAITSGRRKHNLIVYLCTISVMLFFSPLLYKSLSFQLSVGATGAMLFLWPLIRGWFKFLPSVLGDALGTTLAVQIVLTPWLMLKFATFSWAVFPVNALVLPVMESVMLLGLVWLGLAFIMPAGIARLLSWFLWLPVEYMVRLVNLFTRFDWLYFENIKLMPQLVVVYYLALAFWLWWSRRSKVDAKTEVQIKPNS